MRGPLAVRKDEQTRQEPQHCEAIHTINVSHFGLSVCGESNKKQGTSGYGLVWGCRRTLSTSSAHRRQRNIFLVRASGTVVRPSARRCCLKPSVPPTPAPAMLHLKSLPRNHLEGRILGEEC